MRLALPLLAALAACSASAPELQLLRQTSEGSVRYDGADAGSHGYEAVTSALSAALQRRLLRGDIPFQSLLA